MCVVVSFFVKTLQVVVLRQIFITPLDVFHLLSDFNVLLFSHSQLPVFHVGFSFF